MMRGEFRNAGWARAERRGGRSGGGGGAVRWRPMARLAAKREETMAMMTVDGGTKADGWLRLAGWLAWGSNSAGGAQGGCLAGSPPTFPWWISGG